MKNTILLFASLLVATAARAGQLINGNQINPQTAISISTLTVTGKTGLTVTSSATANSFFGDGSHLTGIPSTGSISGVYMPLAGGTFTGQVTNTSTETIQGNAFSVGGSSFTISGGTGAVAYQLTVGSLNSPGIVQVNPTSSTNQGYFLNNSNTAAGVPSLVMNDGGNHFAVVQSTASGTTTKGQLGYNTTAGTFGTPVLTWTDLNQIGIGQINPSYKLDVNGAIQSTGVFINAATAEIAFQQVGNFVGRLGTTGDLWLNSVLGQAVALGVNNSTVVWVSGSQAAPLVGIGTTSPADGLQVNGSAAFGSLPTVSTFSTTGSLALASAATITVSSSAFMGVSIATQAAGSAGVATTVTCPAGKFALNGGCSCQSGVGTTTETNMPAVNGSTETVSGAMPNSWYCQQTGTTGGQCSAFISCSNIRF